GGRCATAGPGGRGGAAGAAGALPGGGDRCCGGGGGPAGARLGLSGGACAGPSRGRAGRGGEGRRGGLPRVGALPWHLDRAAGRGTGAAPVTQGVVGQRQAEPGLPVLAALLLDGGASRLELGLIRSDGLLGPLLLLGSRR